MHERCGIGEAKADMLGDPRHGNDPGTHIHARPSNTVAYRVIDLAFPRVGDPGAVTEKDQVDQSALSDAGDILEQAYVGVVATDASPLLTPGRFNLRPRHVDCQMHLCLHGIDSIRMVRSTSVHFEPVGTRCSSRSRPA